MLAFDDEHIALLKKFFEDELAGYGDLITTEQVGAFLGYSKSTPVNWREKHRIKSFKISGKYLIPKISLVEFLVSSKSFCIHAKPVIHKQLLWKFISGLEE